MGCVVGNEGDFSKGVCPYGEEAGHGAGCIRPLGHDGPHYVTPGDSEEDDA